MKTTSCSVRQHIPPKRRRSRRPELTVAPIIPYNKLDDHQNELILPQFRQKTIQPLVDILSSGVEVGAFEDTCSR